MDTIFLPGTLVRARGRDWVVQSGSTGDWLRLRPMGGAEDEVTELTPRLEKVEDAVFGWPHAEKTGPWWSANLLYNALRFQLRNGAGPFRSFGSIAVEPRSYQLVPLLMAMRQSVVRLLIADDVGIGKTIEAGLIVRELLDRGEIAKFAVVCPPHLVDQWVAELDRHFNLKAEALTAGSAGRLDKLVPHGKRLSDIFPYLVVSLDYIKGASHRDYFLTMNFDMIVVDEAHTCTLLGSGTQRQLRFELLRKLAEDPNRHMLFLTATPHSGNEDGFFNLLSLLKKEFGGFRKAGADTPAMRRELAKHFVQRRRQDIAEWRVSENDRVAGFPKRMTTDLAYELTPAFTAFLEAVQDYCAEMLRSKEDNQIIWYAVIAMLRCVSSSPQAALQTLLNRVSGAEAEADAALAEDEFSEPDAGLVSDVEPALPLEAESAEGRLISMAKALLETPKNDAKLQLLIQHVRNLVREGFHPVVFCRYIATAKYVAEALRQAFSKEAEMLVECVTGELVPEERHARVEGLIQSPKRVLVATDCLSEGINLQEALTAVVHYDLAWNPTRHEQREGRIDRFGQKAPEVRCSMIYGSNNPIDGFILRVILRKSEVIRKSLGVTVPVPVDTKLISKALIEATVFRRKAPASGGQSGQGSLFGDAEFSDSQGKLFSDAELEESWKYAFENAKRSNTIFAQQAIHPEDIYPLWEAQCKALGGHSDVEAFCREAAAGLGFRLEPAGNSQFLLPLAAIRTKSIGERLKDEGFRNDALIDFRDLHRSSPFVSALAEGIAEEAMSGESTSVVRSAVTVSDKADRVTQVYLLRLRFQMRLAYRNQTQRILMAEEILPVSVSGRRNPVWDDSGKAGELLSESSRGNFPKELVVREIEAAKTLLRNSEEKLSEIAKARAAKLLADHTQTKEFTAHGSVAEVSPCLPVDVMGIFVLLPADDE